MKVCKYCGSRNICWDCGSCQNCQQTNVDIEEEDYREDGNYDGDEN